MGEIRPHCTRCGRIVIYIGIAEAVVFIVLKVALGLAGGSRALVAASLYSFQDLISSLVAAIGLNISVRPPDRTHPYGHGKVEYLAVVLMSLMILLGVIALAVTVLGAFFGGATVAEPPTMLVLWIAVLCGLCCWLLSRFQECVGNRLNSPALTSCAAHMHSDYLASVAVVVSVIGARLGYPALDHIVAIIEAVHVVYVSGRMLGSAINGLIDATADADVIDKLKRVTGEVEPVTRVRQATARWSGQSLLAQIEVEVPGHMVVAETDRLRARIQHAVKKHVCRHGVTLVRIAPVSTG
jgi:cation diffusion facilitator family transporter